MTGEDYDPERHDTQLVAAFPNRRAAAAARDALLGAGIPASAIELLPPDDAAEPAVEETSFWRGFQLLFAPADEAHAFGDAVHRGQSMVIVHPVGAAERDNAIEVLEGSFPLDLDEQPEPKPVDHRVLNHASVSRADMAERHGVPISEPEPAPAPIPAAIEERAPGISYTYGVPDDVARELTAEEQVLAQSPASDAARSTFVRIVEERLRTGWRDRREPGARVRQYIAERQPISQRVELREEEIMTPTDRTAS